MADTNLIVDFEPIGKRVEAKAGITILDAIRQAGLPITADCGGLGLCGQCRVIVRQQLESLAPITPTELNWFTETELTAGYRLACEAVLLGDVRVDLPSSSLILGQRLQVTSNLYEYAPPDSQSDNIIQAYPLTLPAANIHDLRSDLSRAFDKLSEAYGLTNLTASPAVVRNLSPLLRQNQWQITALVRGQEVIGFLSPGKHPLGLAVDLGTTKIAVYLLDLTTGETLAAEGIPNPQIGYGEDVISRLVYAENSPEGSAILAQAVHTTLAEIAQTLAKNAGVSTQEIAEVCMVGNTAMTHLLLELPISQLAMAPYVPAASTPLEGRASDMGLPFANDCRVYIPSCVAGFVGADLVSMTLATGIGQDKRAVMGIDIGTNTEIVLALPGRKRMMALSCASGPAFEGAHIRYGMRAAAGGIERVRIIDGKPMIQTIGKNPPVGICGSGIIDAVAELRRIGAINYRGRFQETIPGVRLGKYGLEYLLVPSEESGSGEDISITQHDVNEIQLAKGAIRAGITVLLQTGGVQAEDLDEIILAGAFGTYLNLDTAIAMNLLPDLPLQRYRQVGNAAGVGAKQMLLSRRRREQANAISQQIEYVELTVYPDFRNIFAQSMLFYR